MANIEGPKDSVQRLKFKGEEKDKLREYLRKELSVTDGDRSRMLEKCKLWVQQANSRRKRKGLQHRHADDPADDDAELVPPAESDLPAGSPVRRQAPQPQG